MIYIGLDAREANRAKAKQRYYQSKDKLNTKKEITREYSRIQALVAYTKRSCEFLRKLFTAPKSYRMSNML